MKPQWTSVYALATLALVACAQGESADAALVRDAAGSNLPPLRDTEVPPGDLERGPPDPARDATTAATDVGPQRDQETQAPSLDLGPVADAAAGGTRP
jgi:hypothetical protein